MGFGARALVAAVAGGLAAGTAAAQAPASGPVAVYWVSAATTTGMQARHQRRAPSSSSRFWAIRITAVV